MIPAEGKDRSVIQETVISLALLFERWHDFALVSSARFQPTGRRYFFLLRLALLPASD